MSLGTSTNQGVGPVPTKLSLCFSLAFGALLGLCMVKFGNTAITEKLVTPPGDVYEFIFFTPWPITWAYLLLGLMLLLALPMLRWSFPSRRLLLWLPLAWCCWQLVAAAASSDAYLSSCTVRHFLATVLCFYLGFFTLNTPRLLGVFWAAITVCFALVLFVGWSQHFGGLEQTRRYFFLYIYPQMKDVPPEYLKKMATNRIFGTLFYPNTLAGVLLLLLPPIVMVIWNLRNLLTGPARGFLIACLGIAALACLYWSGSKGGWLLMLLLGLVALFHLPFKRRLKLAAIAFLFVAGVLGFAVKYQSFFEKGATSVVARFDYWRAALAISHAHPWLGTGPGTFGPEYQSIRNPGSEPARLVHNDYLQQLSDSGVIGFLIYTAFVVIALVSCYPMSFVGVKQPGPLPGSTSDLFEESSQRTYRFGVWLGLLGWFIQGLFEFSLYVPGSGWIAFALLGSLLACNGVDQKAWTNSNRIGNSV